MKFLRPILSIFLLLTYSVGFAHTLVPHHHIDELPGQVAALVDINDHDDASVSHNHIHHSAHIDEGFIGFLTCIFNEINHSKSVDTYTVDAGISTFDYSALYINTPPLVYTSSLTSTPIIYNRDLIIKPTYFSINSSSLRGPPTFFC